MTLARFVDRVIARLNETPVELDALLAGGAKGSIHNGAAGVAFFLHEVARVRGDDDSLSLARRWCEEASRWAAQATDTQWHEMPFGFGIGASGLSYVEALVSARQGDIEGVRAAVARIEGSSARLGERASEKVRATEYLGGAAGIVCLARDLLARLPVSADLRDARATLERVRDRATAHVLARYDAPVAPGPRDYLGFAHGIAGELWALVGALGAGHPVVRARLAELAALRETDEEGLVYWLPWPGSDATQLLGTWCSGMAGHTLLWSEVARQTRAEEASELARRCAESVVILDDRTPTICCGLAGHAVALHRYAEVSGDAKARRQGDRRLVLAARIAEEEGETSFAGLWQGALGVAMVAMARIAGEKTVACIEPLGASR